MNRDDVMRMARESGWNVPYEEESGCEDCGIDLERFAALVATAEREACSKARAGKPRELSPVGTGALLDEQQHCFDKGWKEGVKAVRAAIRARGEKGGAR